MCRSCARVCDFRCMAYNKECDSKVFIWIHLFHCRAGTRSLMHARWRTRLTLHWARSNLLRNLTTKLKGEVMQGYCKVTLPVNLTKFDTPFLHFFYWANWYEPNLKHISWGFVIQKYTQLGYVAFSCHKDPFPHKEKTWFLPLMWQWLLSATGDTCLSVRMWLQLLDHQLNSIFAFSLIHLHKRHFAISVLFP